MGRKVSALLVAATVSLLLAGGEALPAQEAGELKANLDLPYDALGEEAEEEDAPEIVVFYGQIYEADGIFFCCDKSGSMREGGKFRRLQSEVIKNIQQFSDRVQFAIVFYDQIVNKYPSSGSPASGTPDAKAAGVSWVMGARPGTSTCTKQALMTCLDYADRSSAKRKVIIHLSDGILSCPPNNRTQYSEETLAEVTTRNSQRVSINSICIGKPGRVDEDWMRKLASLNKGSFARIVE